MVRFHIEEEDSCITLAILTNLKDALSVLKNTKKAYYIYQQNEFSTLSYGVWKSGQKIASEKYW